MKRKNFLSYCKASLDRSEFAEVKDCLESGWLTMGNKVLRFEKAFAEYVGVKYALSVNSCTAALHLALLAHEVGNGDEVLVPSFTFVSTVNVIVHVGAKPVFVDIDPQTLNIDPQDVLRKITKKTKAIMAVHFAGLPAELTELKKIAKEHKLVLIEDAAHAVGSMYKKKQIGAHGNTTCFSFYATKTITTGEGGMLTTNDSKIAEFIMRNRLHGISKDAWKRYMKGGSWKYDVLFPGFKCNMTDLQASLGIHQLEKLEQFIDKRREYATQYNQGFASNPNLLTFPIPSHIRHSHHLYTILLQRYDRDKFIQKMSEFNIGTSVHFIPVHQFTYYKEAFPVKAMDLANTNEIAEQIVSLPLYPSMKKSDVAYVIKVVNQLTMER